MYWRVYSKITHLQCILQLDRKKRTHVSFTSEISWIIYDQNILFISVESVVLRMTTHDVIVALRYSVIQRSMTCQSASLPSPPSGRTVCTRIGREKKWVHFVLERYLLFVDIAIIPLNWFMVVRLESKHARCSDHGRESKVHFQGHSTLLTSDRNRWIVRQDLIYTGTFCRQSEHFPRTSSRHFP